MDSSLPEKEPLTPTKPCPQPTLCHNLAGNNATELGFHPETALLPNLCVNLLICLCGVDSYASAQMFDFLDLVKNCSFPI